MDAETSTSSSAATGVTSCKTKMEKMELRQCLEEVQISYASINKEVYDLKQCTITKMALCISHINTLEDQMH